MTFKQNDQGGGVNTFANCPFSCVWVDGGTGTQPGVFGGDYGYANSQRWGSAGIQDADFGQSGAGIRPGPADGPAALGTPFLLGHFLHNNYPIRGDSPTAIGLQIKLDVRAPAGPAARFELLGGNALHLRFLETHNAPTLGECDPGIQVSTVPCDDLWALEDNTTDSATAAGVTWHLEILGWRKPGGAIADRYTTDEFAYNQRDLYAKVTVDTNTTTSTLAVTDDASTLTLTTTPVPQTGGTVSFTDGDAPIAGCTDVPVNTTTGVTTCSPGDVTPGTHTFGGGFSGGIGYAASTATPVEHTDVEDQTVTFEAPTGLTYGDAETTLTASASSGLPVTFAGSTPNVCTVTGTGTLHIVAAGDCTVTASQVGDTTHAPAEQARTFAIDKATLTVTADPKSKVAGTANPTLTATIAGFVNGDPASVVAGSPTLSTTATTASPPGSYPIDVSVASLSAANYDFVAVPGTLTVTAADTCTRRISGRYRLPLIVDSGTTCVAPGTQIDGSVVVTRGASLVLDGATVRGAVIAAEPAGLRMCGTKSNFVTVVGATGPVVIGDPARGCAGNTIKGWLTALNNTGGFVASGNTITGKVLAIGNR